MHSLDFRQTLPRLRLGGIEPLILTAQPEQISNFEFG